MEIEQANMGNYLKASEVKEGDIVTFLQEGVKQTKNWDGKDKTSYAIPVSCSNGNEYQYSPTGKSLAMLCNALGKETKAWVGRRFKCHIVTTEFKGKELVVIRPVVLPVNEAVEETI